MKICWIVNTWLPEISAIRKKDEDPFGGWLHQSSMELSQRENINLTILYPSIKDTHFVMNQGQSISYVAFPRKQIALKKDLIISFFEVHAFDLVHIHGTEQDYHLTFVEILNELNIPYVISIQGVMTKIAEKYSSDLPEYMMNQQTFRDKIKRDSLKKQQERFSLLAKREQDIIKSSKHVIGRTIFDKEYVLSLNPNISYHHVDESLRKSFYEHTWTYQEDFRYHLFMSQGSYPIKGLHTLLHAMHMLIATYPKLQLHVTGENIFKKGIFHSLRRNSYARYILKLIKSYQLENHVSFLGILNEKDMIEVYKNHYVYVLPSYIENSSNSLAEAMILGMPIVSSTEGGSSEFLKHQVSGLYVHIYDLDDLYQKLDEALSHPKKMIKMGQVAKEDALKRFNLHQNIDTVISTYQAILKENKLA